MLEKLLIYDTIYEDEEFLLCYLIHSKENAKILDRARYHLLFKNSIFGYKYLTLIHKTNNNFILHAETEFITESNYSIIRDMEHFLRQIYNPKVLFLGVGTAYLAKRFLTYNDNIDITFYDNITSFEMIKDVLVEERTLNIKYVNIYDNKKVLDIDKNLYDVIVNDIEYSMESNLFYYTRYLKNGGFLYFLSDWNRHNTPYNFLRMRKNEDQLELSDISNVGKDVVDDYSNEIQFYIEQLKVKKDETKH